MKIEGDTTCPHCKKDHAASFDLDKLDVTTPATPLTNVTATGNTQQIIPQEKIVEKIVEKTVAPSDEPFFNCKNGNCDIGLHKNPNYSKVPKEKCKNCGKGNGVKKCTGCGNIDPDEFDTLDEDEINDLKIPMPVIEHDHNHED